MTRSEKLDAQVKILEAAALEFCDHGIDGARMKSIAERAGVNKALLHYYFRSKEQLYIHILEEMMNNYWTGMKDRLETVENKGDVRAVLKTIIDYIVELYYRSPCQRNILFRELSSGGEYLEMIYQKSSDTCNNQCENAFSLFQQWSDSGLIKNINPLSLFINLKGMCMNIFFSEPFYRDHLDHCGLELNEAFYAMHKESVLEIFYNGIIKS
ncbi:MAG: TetR/AcrR family transcriptional regulator [Fibrobacterales bacterium]